MSRKAIIASFLEVVGQVMFKHALRAVGVGKITSKRKTAIRLGSGDDYNWEKYNETYRGEIAKISRTYTLQLTEGGFRYIDGVLSVRTGWKPLHPNHRLLYETFMQLNPASIAEIGCGGGDHLRNLSVLLPDARIHGYDRAQQQLNFLRERSPDIRAEVRQMDITMPLPKDVAAVDVCYTQAVIMHIQAANSHFVALSNLFHIAKKQVLLMENWERHEFLDDIQTLHKKQMLPWEEVHCYFRRAREFGNKPHLLIASCEPLGYEVLDQYEHMRAA